MVRNLRPNTKTTVTPNIRPVDTFVQPAPIDNTRLKELDAFVGNLVPRLNRYADIQQGRKDKKDVIAAQKAFSTLTDKLLSYDEQVKAGNIAPDQSPMFRFAFNQSQGSQIGLNFIQKASEAYMRSNLPSATNSNGFNSWFDKYKADYIKENEGLLNLIGSFDAFDGYARQAQQNLMSSHLATVKKNFTTKASENAILQAEKAVEAAEAMIENQIRVAEITDPAMQKELGRNLAIAAAQEITKSTNDMVKASSNFIKYPKQNKKVIDAITLKYLSLADLKMDDDDSVHISNLKTILENVKTRDGQSLFDTTYGEAKFFETARAIRDNFTTRVKQQNELLNTNRENTENKIINEVYKVIDEYPILDNESLLLAIETNQDLMKEITDYGLGNWKNTALDEFGKWLNNSEEPMTDIEKAVQHNQLINNQYFADPLENLREQYQQAKDNISTGILRGDFALEILNKINNRIVTLERERVSLGRAEANARADFYQDPSFKNVTKFFEAEDKSLFGKIALKLGTEPQKLLKNYNEFKRVFSNYYFDEVGGKRTWFQKQQPEREIIVQNLFEKYVASKVAVEQAGNTITSDNANTRTTQTTGTVVIEVTPQTQTD